MVSSFQDPGLDSTGLSAMTIQEFGKCHYILPVQSTVLGHLAYFASSPEEIKRLLKRGIPRGSIWSARELRLLLRLPGLAPGALPRIAEAKELFNGIVGLDHG